MNGSSYEVAAHVPADQAERPMAPARSSHLTIRPKKIATQQQGRQGMARRSGLDAEAEHRMLARMQVRILQAELL